MLYSTNTAIHMHSDVCVCVCVLHLLSLLSLGITSYRCLLHKGNGLKSQGENIIVAPTSVWKCVCMSVLRPWPPQDISSPIREPAHERADDDGGGLTETPSRFLCVCIKNNWNNNNNNRKKKKKGSPPLPPLPGQDHKVSIWGDVRARHVFSKSTTPSGIFLPPRSSAEHPSTNSHQSESAEGNARKVYLRTQRGFTLLLDESRRRRRRIARSQPRRRFVWVNDTLALTEHGQMTLTWQRFQGIVSDGVVTREDHSHQELGKVPSHFLNTSQVPGVGGLILRSGADASRSRVLRVDQASSCSQRSHAGSSWGAAPPDGGQRLASESPSDDNRTLLCF